MKKGDSVRRAASEMQDRLRRELAKYGCYAYPKLDRYVDKTLGLEGWQAHITPYALYERELQGDWYVSSYWRFVADPRSGDAILWDSSLGINVESWPYGVLDDAGPDRRCFVRYDYDARDKPRRHLNVMQPRAIADNLHWRIPTPDDSDEWDCASLVELVLDGAWWDELHRRGGWPKGE